MSELFDESGSSFSNLADSPECWDSSIELMAKCDPPVFETGITSNQEKYHVFRKQRRWKSLNSVNVKSRYSFSVPPNVDSDVSIKKTRNKTCFELSTSISSRFGGCEPSDEVVNIDESDPPVLITNVQGSFLDHWEGRESENKNSIDKESRDSSSKFSSNGFETPDLAFFEPSECSSSNSLRVESCEPPFEVVTLEDEYDSSASGSLKSIDQQETFLKNHKKIVDSEISNFIKEKSPYSHPSSNKSGSDPYLSRFEPLACSLRNSSHAQICEPSIELAILDDKCDSSAPEILITGVQGNCLGYRKDENGENPNSTEEKSLDSVSHPANDGSKTDYQENPSLACFQSVACNLEKASIEVISLEDKSDPSSPKLIITAVEGNFLEHREDRDESRDLFSHSVYDGSKTDVLENPTLACFDSILCSAKNNLLAQSCEPSIEVISLEDECDSSSPATVQGNFLGPRKDADGKNSNSIKEKSRGLPSYPASDRSEIDALENPSLSSFESLACSLPNNLNAVSSKPSVEVVTLEDECNPSVSEMLITEVAGNFDGHGMNVESENSKSTDEKSQNLFSHPSFDGFQINYNKIPNLELFEPLACSLSNSSCHKSCKPTIEVVSLDESDSCATELLMTTVPVNLNVLWKKRGSENKKHEDRLSNFSSGDLKVSIKEFHSLAQEHESSESSEITTPIIKSAYSVEKFRPPNLFDPGEGNISRSAQPAENETIDAENPRYSTPVSEGRKETSSGPISGGSIPCLGGRGDEGIPQEDDCMFLTRVVATTTDDTPLVPRKGRLLLKRAENSSRFSESPAESIAGTYGKEPVAELVVSPPKTASPVGRLPPHSESAAKSSLSASTLSESSREEAVGRTEQFVSSPPALYSGRSTSVTHFVEKVQPLERHQNEPTKSSVDGSTRRDSSSCDQTRCLRVSARSEASNSTKTSPSSAVKPWSSGLFLPTTPREREGPAIFVSASARGTKRRSKSARGKSSRGNSVARCLKPQCKDCVPCFFTAPPLPPPSEEGSSLRRIETTSEKHPEIVRTWSTENECRSMDSELEMRNLDSSSPINCATTMRQGRKRKDSPPAALCGLPLPGKEQGCVKTPFEECSPIRKRVSFAASNHQDVSVTLDPTLKMSNMVFFHTRNGRSYVDIGNEGEGTRIVRRKRGRPRKDSNGKEEDSKFADTQIVRRKRGRPRKDSNGKEEDAKFADTQIVKRKRGRPRKNTV